MRKFIIYLTLVLLASVLFLSPAALSDDIQVFINDQNKTFNPPPVIKDGRTLVPMRAFFEALGCEVTWDAETRTAIGTRGGTEVRLPIGSKTGYINGKPHLLAVEAQLINNSTFIPLRFVSEALGETVVWEAPTRTIKITSTAGVKLPKQEMEVHFLDVGQGDCILVISPNGSVMLIDAGPPTAGQKIVSYLKKAGISVIDKFVATHPHADHIGGAQDVFDNFVVKKVYDSGYPHTTLTYERFLTTIDNKNIPYAIAHRGNKINLDKDISIEIIHPGTTMGDANNNSIVLWTTYGQISFLFTGDIEREAEEFILQYYDKIPAQILKVAHHGSRTSTTVQFLNAVNPEVAVIQVGADNRYGHPHQETLNNLAQAGVKVLRNDIHGDIVITTDGRSYSINKLPESLPAIEDKPSYSIPTQPEVPGKININTASLEELLEIVHIGPDRAKQIIQLRPFRSLDELTRVSGIGPARLADIKAEGKAYVE